MSLITVKPKFQVTIPAKLREKINLHEGDLMEATLVDGGIFMRPKTVVDRDVAADRIEGILRRTKPSFRDKGRAESEIMEDVVADIVKARKQRRTSGA